MSALFSVPTLTNDTEHLLVGRVESPTLTDAEAARVAQMSFELVAQAQRPDRQNDRMDRVSGVVADAERVVGTGHRVDGAATSCASRGRKPRRRRSCSRVRACASSAQGIHETAGRAAPGDPTRGAHHDRARRALRLAPNASTRVGFTRDRLHSRSFAARSTQRLAAALPGCGPQAEVRADRGWPGQMAGPSWMQKREAVFAFVEVVAVGAF